MSEKEMKAALEGVNLGEIRYFHEIPSTNLHAIEWITDTPPQYSISVANFQSKGYGRHDRTWITNPDNSLAFSMIIYPSAEEVKKLALFSPLAACAIHQAVMEIAPQAPLSIKWPNDLLLKKKKTAGVLVESSWSKDKLQGIVVGIGVNVNHGSVPVQNHLLYPATCLEEGLHISIDRWDIMAKIIKSFMILRKTFLNKEFLEFWQSRLAFIGKPIFITNQSGNKHEGIFRGVDNDGYLVLKEKSGRIIHFPIGDVSLRPV